MIAKTNDKEPISCIDSENSAFSIQLIPYNPMDLKHRLFMLSLLKESGHLYHDSLNQDALMRLKGIEGLLVPGLPRHFIVSVKGEFAGFIGGIVDVFNIAFVEGVSARNFQSFWPARQALFKFCQYCFKTLKAEKITVQIPITNYSAELVCRSIGFRKEGLKKKEIPLNGKRLDATDLAVFPETLSIKNSRKHLVKFLKYSNKKYRKDFESYG